MRVDLEKVASIVKGLDPDNDVHWTEAGQPAMAIIEAEYGSKVVTRHDVKRAVPNWSREAAKINRDSNTNQDTGDRPADPDPDGGHGPAHTLASPMITKDIVAATGMRVLDVPTLVAIAGCDAILLMEAAWLAAQSDRYRRNSALTSLTRGYEAEQRSIKEWQGRIDEGAARRAEAEKRANAATK